MKRRTTNKLLAYLLVLVMLLSASMTALAEGSSDVSGNDAVITETQPAEEPSVSDNASTDETDLSAEESEEAVSQQEEVSENSVSDNEIAEEEESVFPGLPANFKMSASMLDYKRALTDTLDDMDDMIEGREYKTGEVIFYCDTEEEAELYAEAYGAVLKSYSDKIGVLLLPEDVTVKSAVKAAADVKTMLPPVSPNYYRYAMDTDEEILSEESYAVAAAAYNDPNLKPTSTAYQWFHQVVGSSYAWNNGYDGTGIKVAVLDNGVAPHEDLVITGNYNAANPSSTTYYEAATAESYGNNHGTHVAGIIAAKNNNSKGGSGIAPGAAIYNIKVLGSEDEAGTSATLARGINKAVEWKVDVINMSLGGAGYTTAEQQAVTNAYNAGIAVFAAAGNDGSQTISYPAGLPYVICVAATNTNHTRASFSNYGTWVDLSAPGVGIYSTIQGNAYGSMDGTSQATPVAAGTAAVLLQAGIKDSKGVALTGAQKVAALERMMKSNVIKAIGGKIGSGITSLPKALKLSTILTAPNKPVFNKNAGTYINATLDVSISAEGGMTIYYSTDGKTPTYKNGVVANGIKYTGTPVTLSGIVNGKVTGKMTLKAIAVNAVGKVSKVTSATYTFKPAVTGVTITGLKEVPAGKSITLSAAVTPAYAKIKTVEWSISGDSKTTGVSINKKNGKVTATAKAKAGTYTVTATATDGSKKSATYTITVTEAARIGSMAFSEKSKTLEKGSSTVTSNVSTLLTIKDAKGNVLANTNNVSWTSSNAAVATVNASGIVTAVGAGNAVITATAADGSGKKATIKVTVTMLPTSLTITGSKILGVGKSIALKAVVNPTTAADKTVTWTISGDPKTTGVSINAKNGKVTASKTATAGSYTVKATTKNGVSNTCTVTVNNAITSLKLADSTVNLFRVAGNYGAATSKAVNLTVAGGYNASSLEVVNSAPGVVSCTLNNKVLTVSATGNTTGKAVITVKATDGSGKSAKVTVNVVNPSSNLTISPQAGREGYLGNGKKLTLSGVLETEFGTLTTASKKLKWSSSDTSVATVDSKGVVTAKKSGGNAVITAEATDGSNVRATYEIYTFNAINTLSVGRSGWVVDSNNRPLWYQISIRYNYLSWQYAGVYPELSVEVGNPQMMSVTSSQSLGTYGELMIIPYKAGSSKITVKALDGSGKSLSFTMTFK